MWQKKLLSTTNVVKALLISVLLVSCAAVDKLPEKPVIDTVKFESRASLLNWYDATHKSYYGLKGPVETLIAKPVAVSGNPRQVANDGWELKFSRQGRLLRKKRIGDEVEFETIYAYSEKNQPTHIASYMDGKLWRTSSFIYANGKLLRVDFIDRKSGDKYSVRNEQQKTRYGWFEIQMPVEKTELPGYTEYLRDGSLVWSNKGDINNGLGEQYYLRTVDNVTSSSVANQGTAQMAGQGGYRYQYNENGLLKTVKSYNAHNNRLFHTTRYLYNDLWLLASEHKKVTDSSPFNQAIDEQVEYQYNKIDKYGNWLERVLAYKNKHQSLSYTEKRTISYYQD